MSLVLTAKLAAARAVGGITRRAGRGGTSLPGKVLIRLEPHAITELSTRLPNGTAIVSATNGKTTTAAMVASILRRAGVALVHNRAGANMAGGVASALLAAAHNRGIDGELGLFEVDEFWLDRIAPQLQPRAVLLGNLFRDQLDRYGELDTIADRWAAAVGQLPAGSALVLNADDPLVADLGRAGDDPATTDLGQAANRATYFGVEDPAMAIPEMQHASDSKHCRRCGAAYVYEAIYLGHLGRYRCPSCGQERPAPDVAAKEIVLDGTRAASFRISTPAGEVPVKLPLPGLYNVYNALGAAALCLELQIDLDAIAAGLSSVTAAFGRAETVTIDSTQLQVLLIKNPAGANEILRTLALEGGELDLLAILNDRTADGRDISWVWDADFELLASDLRRVTCAGTRAAELALRLKYAGVPENRLDVQPELARALDEAVAGARGQAVAHPAEAVVRLGEAPAPTAEPRLFVLPTYTALLELHALLASRGHVNQFWENGAP
jgi:UDP-N-acetylmuramyl tripeptide synthase